MPEENGHTPAVTIRTIEHDFWEQAIIGSGGVEPVKQMLQRQLDGIPADPIAGRSEQPGLRKRLAELSAALIMHIDTPEDDRGAFPEHDDERAKVANRRDKLCVLFAGAQTIACFDCLTAYLEGECKILLGQIKRIEARLAYSDTFVEKLKESV